MKRATHKKATIVHQLEEIEDSGPGGVVTLGSGAELAVTSLNKIFFPDDGYTKGDLMRYYARVADVILPAIADRPLVLKRYPNGIKGQSFYQQNAAPNVPKGVRVETIRSDRGERQRRYVGGDLTTLLYTVQLGAISVDPWHTRVSDLSAADYTILDLDPGPGTSFRDVVEVALLVHDIIEEYGFTAVPKTSGSSGIHIVIPLEADLSDETAMLAAQIIATQVAERAPSLATVERAVKARPKGTVYVDYLQNIRGKSVAGVYSARARAGATVSTPLEWKEVNAKLDPGKFTIETVPRRLERVGDIWARAMKRRNSVRALLDSLPKKPKSRR